MYNAEQLKLSCLQFIGLNMAALLEARLVGFLCCMIFAPTDVCI